MHVRSASPRLPRSAMLPSMPHPIGTRFRAEIWSMHVRGDRLTNLVLSGHTLLSSEALGVALSRCPNLTSFDFSSSLFRRVVAT